MATLQDVVKTARGLISEDADNPEYDRALAELVTELSGLPMQEREAVRRRLYPTTSWSFGKCTAREVVVCRPDRTIARYSTSDDRVQRLAKNRGGRCLDLQDLVREIAREDWAREASDTGDLPDWGGELPRYTVASMDAVMEYADPISALNDPHVILDDDELEGLEMRLFEPSIMGEFTRKAIDLGLASQDDDEGIAEAALALYTAVIDRMYYRAHIKIRRKNH